MSRHELTTLRAAARVLWLSLRAPLYMRHYRCSLSLVRATEELAL